MPAPDDSVDRSASFLKIAPRPAMMPATHRADDARGHRGEAE
jgi:hypothetical protein